MNRQNVYKDEIIGLDARILESTDPTFVGMSGTVIFETKNMISIRTGSSVKQISKKVARKIALKTDFGLCLVMGSSLVGRPEDRISR